MIYKNPLEASEGYDNHSMIWVDSMSLSGFWAGFIAALISIGFEDPTQYQHNLPCPIDAPAEAEAEADTDIWSPIATHVYQTFIGCVWS